MPLAGARGFRKAKIAGKVNKDKASITRILDIMQKNGLIKRCDDEADRRSYRIFLTPTGRKSGNKAKTRRQSYKFKNLSEPGRI